MTNQPSPASMGAPRTDPRLVEALAGRYRIERELGRGGMATVYLAHDLRHGRKVAVKVMHAELALGRERFFREIGVAAGLTHPHIVALHDSGEADGLLYYVMPYVAGRTLRERINDGTAFSVTEVVRIASQVAGALGAAHDRGIVHRDIKPENILITGRGTGGHALVADFGVAMAAHLAGDEKLTRTGVSVGTPAYMSPEQLYAADVDARSDIWALGCIMVEMLTGQLVGRSAAGGSGAMDRVTGELRRLRPDVPESLVQVIRRSLAADPAMRFPSGRDLADALDAVGASAGPATRRSMPRLVALIGAAAVLVALAAWIVRRSAAQPVAPRDPEVARLYERGMREFERRTPEGADEAVRSFHAALRRDSTFAPAWVGLSNAYTRSIVRQWNFPGSARDSLLRLAVAASRRALALDSTDPRAWAARAEVARHVDPTEMGVPLRAARRAIALDSSSDVAWFILGLSLADSGDLDAGLTAWREGAQRNPTYNQGLAFLSLGHFWRGHYDSAVVWADSSVSIDPSYFLARHSLGLVEIERGNFVRAVAALESARRITTGPDVVVALSGRALAEARSGDRRAARATLRIADSLGRQFEPAPLHVAVYMAAAYGELGDPTAARAWLARYPVRLDRHFQLHVQCEPAFAALARDSSFRDVMRGADPISGCVVGAWKRDNTAGR